MALLRRGLVLLAGLALGLIALVLVIFIALQNNWVRSQLLSLAESSLADAGLSVEVGGLEGVLPFDFALGHLRLYDADGAWLSVEQFRLAWDPWRLLQGELRVSRLSISALDLPRLPPSAPAEPEPDTPLELKLELPGIPHALPRIVLEHLAVDRLALGQAIIGQAVVLGIHGEMRTLPGPEITARLSVERLDSQSLEATVQARIAGRPAKLDLTIDLEDRGELVRRLAGLPGEGPVTARLDGTGTAAVWIGELALGAGGLGQLDAGLRLGIEPEFFLETKGRVAPSMDLLPAAVVGLIGDRPEFEVFLARTGPQQMALRTLVLKLAVADLAGTARVDLADSTLESQIEVRVPDLARLSELAGQALEGGASLTVGASGPLMQPEVQVRLQSELFAAYGAAFDEAWLDAQLSLAASLDQGFPGASVVVKGAVEALALEAAPGIPARTLRMAGRITAPNLSELNIESLSLEGGGARVDTAGRVDLETLVGDIRLSAEISDPAPWASAFGSPIGAGQIKADTSAQFDGVEGNVVAEVTGHVRGLVGLPEGVSPIVGSDLDLSLKATLTDRDRVRLESTSLRGAGVAVSATGEAALQSGRVDAKLGMVLPDLAPLSALAGADVAGGAALSADVDGTFESPNLQARVLLSELFYGDRDLRRLEVMVSAADLIAGPRGDLNFTIGPKETALGLAVQFALSGRELAIPKLRLDGPGTGLDGELAVNLDGPLVAGKLRGSVDDLRSLVYWHGDATLQGALTTNIALEPSGGQQGARMQVRGSRLGGTFGTVEAVSADLKAADLLSLSGMDAAIAVDRFESAGISLERTEVTARGSASKLGIGVRVGGNVIRELNLDARAEVETRPEGTTVVLQRLDGDFAGRRVSLGSPATIELLGRDIRLAALRLGLDEARLSADVRYGPQQLAGELVLSDLPMSLVREFADLDLEGNAAARLKLTGTPAAPSAVLALRLRDMALAGQDVGQLPPGDLALDATLGNGRLEATLNAERITQEPIRLRVELPVEFALVPARFAVAEGAPIGGAIQARADLGRLSRLIELDDQTLEGLLVVDLKLAGTLTTPQMTGQASLTEGKYERGATGTLLHGIEAQIVASGRAVRLESLQATDGHLGRISGRGALSLAPNDRLDFTANLDLANAVLMRSDNLNLTMSGALAVEGDPESGSARGTLTVNQAEFRIPDRFGPSVPTIEVKELYDGEPLTEVSVAPSGPGYDLTLDIGVELPSRVFVRGRGLESEWIGNLKVSGTADEPKIVGKLEIRRGFFDFLDRRFDLSRGVIEFFGSTPPVPTIDLEARAQGPDMVAILRLQGPASAPELVLDSEPEMPNDEVLSRLLFDRDSSQLSAGEALRLVAAVQALTGGGGTDLMGQARAATGLDRLDVGASTEGASLEAGKYLTEDIFVEVITGTGEQGTRFRVEKEISRRFSIEAGVDQTSNSSFGINWGLDY